MQGVEYYFVQSCSVRGAPERFFASSRISLGFENWVLISGFGLGLDKSRVLVQMRRPLHVLLIYKTMRSKTVESKRSIL